jgi:hypothetical protein
MMRKVMATKEKTKTSDPSQLFTLRVWTESVNQDNRQIRVQVKHVLSGATRTFLQWSQVIEFIDAQLLEHRSDQIKGDE